ncbi:unnamed protein product [Ixodes pacificus]
MGRSPPFQKAPFLPPEKEKKRKLQRVGTVKFGGRHRTSNRCENRKRSDLFHESPVHLSGAYGSGEKRRVRSLDCASHAPCQYSAEKGCYARSECTAQPSLQRWECIEGDYWYGP